MNGEELFALGEKYYYGVDDVAVDKEKALLYFKQSAESGYNIAQLMVGYMYDFADGVMANPEQAIFWYQKTSDAGNGDATLNLANIYIEGRGVAQNIPKGNKLYELAIFQHNAVAASNLGNHYLMGIGVPISLKEGAKYIALAEQWGYIHSQDMNNLGCSYKQIGNYAEAFKCFTKAVIADNTNQGAIWNYGFSLYNEQGTIADYTAAEPYLVYILNNNPNDEQAKLLVKGINLYKYMESCLEIVLGLIQSHGSTIYEIYLSVRVIDENRVQVVCHFERWDNRRKDEKHRAYYQTKYWNEFEHEFTAKEIKKLPSNSTVMREECTFVKQLNTIALTKNATFDIITNIFKKYPNVPIKIGEYEILYSEC